VNGLVVIDKDKGYTSRDVVNIVSGVLGTKKVGHTGTLDPLATGVMVVGVGKGLKVSELITGYDKVYEARVIIGYETETLDMEGNIVKWGRFDYTKEDIERVIEEFPREYEQVVPIYSAVKVNGKRLYKSARRGEVVELPKRMVSIYELALISDVKVCENHISFDIRCKVSKGTYIRSLVRDIGERLGSYGTMMELRRTRQGNFGLDEAYSIEDIKRGDFELKKIGEVLDIPKVWVNENMLFRIRNGCKMKKFFEGDMALVMDGDSEVAIYKVSEEDEKMAKVYKML
jgi:tRNA pseudouridine55 synthase